jgi:hypothetical protein
VKWANFATILLILVLLSLLAVQWQQLQAMRALVTREATTMTDPGPMELKAAWIHAYDSNNNPIIHVVSVVRNAPSETVTAWKRRFLDQCEADLVNPDTKPYEN